MAIATTNFPVLPALFAVLGIACTPAAPTYSASLSSTDSSLTGCHGVASSSVPADNVYYLTSFGTDADSHNTMSCGGTPMGGTWYYAADRSRFDCGTKIQVTANGNCIIAQVADYGPDVCVENKAGSPILDASPLVAQALFGVDSLGWSDRKQVTVTIADPSAALGTCDATSSSSDGTDPSTGVVTGTGTTGTSSGTGTGVGTGTGTGVSTGTGTGVSTGTGVGTGTGTGVGTGSTSSDPTSSGGIVDSSTCYSSDVGTYVNGGDCVQSVADGSWSQCVDGEFESIYQNGPGPDGYCTAVYYAS